MEIAGKNSFSLKSSNIDPCGNLEQPAGGTKIKLGNVNSPGENEKNIPDKSVNKEPNDGQFQCSKTTSKESIVGRTIKIRKRKRKNINELSGDLFDCPPEYSLAHCVAEDFSMGTGIAAVFKKLFQRTGHLMNLCKSIGEVAILKDEDRFIYYLITKERSFHKPTLHTIEMSLRKMKKHAVKNNVTDIAMPAIGSGPEGLDWNDVLEILREVFEYSQITIHVYVLRNPGGPLKLKRAAIVKHVVKDLVELQKNTGRIYIGNTMGHVTDEMKLLNTKYEFIPYYFKERPYMGDMVSISVNGVVTYGLICQDSLFSLSYVDLVRCISQLQNIRYLQVGIQAFTLHDDPLVMAKLETLLKNGIGEEMTIWICWPEKLKHLMPVCPSDATEGISYN